MREAFLPGKDNTYTKAACRTDMRMDAVDKSDPFFVEEGE